MDYDKFKLHRVGDGVKNLYMFSEEEKKDFRKSMHADEETGFYNTNTGRRNDDIENLAANLGLVNKESPSYNVDFTKLAKEVGMENVNPENLDYDELERRLRDIFDHKIAEEQAQKEAQEKADFYSSQEGRKYKSDKYYREKDKDYKQKIQDAKAEKEKEYKLKKKKGKPKDSEGELVKKNGINKLTDSAKLLDARRQRLKNQMDRLNNAKNIVENPSEAAEEAVKETAKNAAKKVVKKRTDAAKAIVVKKAKSFAKKYILFIIIGFVLLLLIILIAVLLSLALDDEVKRYDSICDFNLTTVNVTKCQTEEVETISLEQYVINTTDSIIAGRSLSDDQIKAVMIIIKTNALVSGGYNNIDKNVNIDDCSIKELFKSSSGPNYSASTSSPDSTSSTPSNGWWWPVGSSSMTGNNIYGGTPVSSVSSTYPDGISSYFGGRVPPTSGASSDHGAIDIPIPTGTPVIASNSGTISSACTVSGCGSGYGNYVEINHGNGISTLYAHLNSISVSNGQTVVKGQLIGYSGSTGISTGPHLHFAVKVNGTAVDPLNYVSLNNPRSGGVVSPTGNSMIYVDTEEDGIGALYSEIYEYLYIDESYKGTISDLSGALTLELNEEVLSILVNTTGSYFNILKSLYKSDDYNLKLYNLDGNCDYTWTDGTGYGDNMSYWWPIGSTQTTESGGVLFASGAPQYTTINSEYGPRTLDGKSGFHNGVDLHGDLNSTYVIAAMDGTVQSTYNKCISSVNDYDCGLVKGGGNSVTILDKFGNINHYYHLYENSILVKEGDSVKQGQVLAKVGNSGHSTGSHLHFEIRVNNQAVNPLDYISAGNPRPVLVNGSMEFAGDSSNNKNYICQSLQKTGFSKNATAAILVNLNAESSLNPINLEGAYETKLGYTDESYTRAVDSGAYSENSFVHDDAGYGLAQWTYWSRKQKLYSFAKSQNASIGNMNMQLTFFVNELMSYTGVYNFLMSNNSAYDMTVYFCRNYENPATSCENRASNSISAYSSYVNNGCN